MNGLRPAQQASDSVDPMTTLAVSNLDNRKPDDFDPFAVDWIFRRLAQRGIRPLHLIWSFPTLLLVLGVSAWLSGGLGYGRLDWATVRGALLGFPPTEPSNQLGLLNDWVTIRLVACISASLILTYYQWQQFSKLISVLLRNRIAVIHRPAAASMRMCSLNRELKRAGGRKLPLIMAVLSMLTLTFTQRSGGSVWPFSIPSSGSPDLYGSWWAGLDTGYVGYLMYVGVGTLGLYYVFAQNYVGLKVLRFFNAEKGNIGYRPNPANPDGDFGWKPIRSLLYSVHVSIVVHGLALMTIMQVIPRGGAIVIAPLFLLFFVMNPFYVLLPLKLLWRPVVEEKQILLRRYEDELESLSWAGPAGSGAKLEASRLDLCHQLREEIALLRAFAVPPFIGRRAILLWMTYWMTFAGFVVSIVNLFTSA